IERDVYTVVGVAPEIAMPEPGAEVWRPGRWVWPPPGRSRMLTMSVEVFGRMKPGVDVDAVRREGQQVALTIATANPAFYDGNVPVPTIVVTRWQDDLVSTVRPALIVLLAGIGVVLAAACVNLANLVLARSTARHREIAVRLALGASRARVARPILFEQLLLAGSGALAGGALAWWILSALPQIAPADLPRLGEVAFNGWSLLFATAVAFTTACAAALLPAWHLPHGHLRELSASSRLGAGARTVSGDRARAVLVVCQVALAAVLLVSAMLVGRSLMSLLRVDPGYRPEGVLTFQVSLPEGWWQQRGRIRGFLSELISRLEHTPGVIAAGATTALPLHRGGSYGTFLIDGRPLAADPSERPTARYQVITGRYFEALGLRVTRGRALADSDVATSEPVVLIDELAASAYFPGEDPIGRKVAHIGRVTRTIVGIVAPVQAGALSGPAFPTMYYPAAQIDGDILTFNRYAGGVAVRTSGDPNALVPLARAAVRELDPGSPVFNAQPLRDRLATTYAQPRFYTIVLALFSALAVTTAMLGIYGILAYMVERQRTEIGVRRALGATEQQVLSLVLGRGIRLAAIGLIVGLAAAALSSRLLRAQLFGVGPFDPVTFVGVAIVITAVVVLASWWPASRAVLIDPARALRTE
ncbi:MAG TPA: FtsX-like permease family protein, partial [Vicinamibacterales bacterium]|nr:FtsX-like permease family protein [Vicinamibacterales bacterium]